MLGVSFHRSGQIHQFCTQSEVTLMTAEGEKTFPASTTIELEEKTELASVAKQNWSEIPHCADGEAVAYYSFFYRTGCFIG